MVTHVITSGRMLVETLTVIQTLDIIAHVLAPLFVGSNYYCKSAGAYPSHLDSNYFSNPLWDGSGCPNGTCCDNTTQPWFYNKLDRTTTSDIEARPKLLNRL